MEKFDTESLKQYFKIAKRLQAIFVKGATVQFLRKKLMTRKLLSLGS